MNAFLILRFLIYSVTERILAILHKTCYNNLIAYEADSVSSKKHGS